MVQNDKFPSLVIISEKQNSVKQLMKYGDPDNVELFSSVLLVISSDITTGEN